MKMITLAIKGTLVTSNIVSKKNRQEVPAKTAYINASDEDLKKAQDFGMTVYGDVDKKTGEFGDGDKWLIVPTAAKVTVFEKGKVVETISGLAEDGTPTFHSDEKTINLALLWTDPEDGINNPFFRLKSTSNALVLNEQIDPFAEMESVE